MKDRIIILVAALMIAATLIMTNHPTNRVNGNAIVASPRLAVQFTTGDGSYRDAPVYPGGQSGWGWLGGWFGGWAGHAFSGWNLKFQ